MDLPIYEINSLKHSYAGKPILEIQHLTVRAASIVGLIGPNGSGKSTLMRLLGFIEKPTTGQILFSGRPLAPFSDEARFQVTLLPQEPFLMKRSVFKNVSYGLKLRDHKEDMAGTVNEALSLVGLSSKEFAQRPWYALSGGEAQRVALAARLALKPKVLLLDEPTASVDAASADLIKEASLRARKELGTTLIVASHDWQWLYEVCDDILHLFRGKVFGSGRETIVFGPWQELEAGRWGRRLSDGQELLVPFPPDKDASAVINVFSIGEDPSKAGPKDVYLRGIISRLTLEKNSGRIFSTIMAANIPFIAGLSQQQVQDQSLFPGKAISICYSLDRVQWV